MKAKEHHRAHTYTRTQRSKQIKSQHIQIGRGWQQQRQQLPETFDCMSSCVHFTGRGSHQAAKKARKKLMQTKSVDVNEYSSGRK